MKSNFVITIDEFLSNIDYSKNYFEKILRMCNINNRYIFDNNDLEKLLSHPVNSQKAYNFRVYLLNVLRSRNS